MTDARQVDERAERVVALLEGNVRDELQVTNAAFELGLSDETIERLMEEHAQRMRRELSQHW